MLKKWTGNRIARAIPLFPIGCPRSGTTFLARILNSHPSVLMTNETAVFLQLNNAITQSRIGYAAGIFYGKEHNELLADHLTEKAKDMIESYYEKIRKIEGKGRLDYWGEKHPNNCECMDFLASLYPQARYIYLARDPRDTVCSISKMLNADLRGSFYLWRSLIIQYKQALQHIDGKSLFRIRYEDLVADCEGTLRPMFDWLGLDFAPETEAYLRKYRDIDAHTFDPARIDFAARSVGRWQREFAESDKHLAEDMAADDIAGDFMRQYEY